jgi:hypothetical protein
MALDALVALGLRDAAAALAKAMGRFPRPYPEDRSRRTEIMIAQGESYSALMNEATGALDEADLPKAMSAAARAAGVLPQ